MAARYPPLRGASALMLADGTVVEVCDFDGQHQMEPRLLEVYQSEIAARLSALPELGALHRMERGQTHVRVSLMELLTQ